MTLLSALKAIRLTTANPARLADFYAAMGFSMQRETAIAVQEMELLGLKGGGTRVSLVLGKLCLDLDSFDNPGRAYPKDATSSDSIFQHFAIVTDDAVMAWERAKANGAIPISRTGPITLPASAGGVTAVKFRDPEGHPLEFLQFTLHDQAGFVRYVDHSAISVSDVAVSRSFYENLGLSLGSGSFNHGQTQIDLDDLPDVEVEVVPLHPRAGSPHLELLGYRSPKVRRSLLWEANDIVATRLVWDAGEDRFLRDPDGHLHLLQR